MRSWITDPILKLDAIIITASIVVKVDEQSNISKVYLSQRVDNAYEQIRLQ